MQSPLTATKFTARMVNQLGPITRLNKCTDTSSYRLDFVLDAVKRHARYNEEDGIPTCYSSTVYGIEWSINSGRINGATHIALKAMKTRDLLRLIHETHEHCANIGEIPAYLMHWQAEKQEAPR